MSRLRGVRVASAVLALVCTFSLPTSLRAQAVPDARWAATLAWFAEELRSDVAADGAGGIIAGVVVGGDLVWAGAWGESDREAAQPLSTNAVSRTGSISKTITAVLMMRLVDAGVIALDDRVRDVLPEVEGFSDPIGVDPITFRQLASHTAGLEREPDWPESVVGPIELWEERVLESIPHTSYDSDPGSRYQYSNIGFGVLGLALSRAAGRPFVEMVFDEILQPLGMTGSSFVVEGSALEPRLAQGYVLREGRVDGRQPAAEHRGRGYKVPNGGVYSTVADLGRFLGALAGVPGLAILSEESRRELLSIQTPEDVDSGYGLGVQLRRRGAHWTVAHGGSVAGYNAYMIVEPESSTGVVLLRNYTGGSTQLGAIAGRVLERLLAGG